MDIRKDNSLHHQGLSFWIFPVYIDFIYKIKGSEVQNGINRRKKIEKIKELRPIDDVLFEVLAEDREVCEEMLRVILEDDKLIVHDVMSSHSPIREISTVVLSGWMHCLH